MAQPSAQARSYLGVALSRMTTPKVHAPHLDAVLVKGERQTEPLSQPFASGVSVVHDSNCTAFQEVSEVSADRSVGRLRKRLAGPSGQSRRAARQPLIQDEASAHRAGPKLRPEWTARRRVDTVARKPDSDRHGA